MKNMGKIILGVAVSVVFVGIYLGSMQGHLIDGAMQELQSVKGSTDEAAGKAADEEANEAAGKAADEEANETAGKAADEKANETAGKAADEEANETAGKAADEAANEIAGKAAVEAANEAAGRALDEEANEVADAAEDETSDRAAGVTADEAAGQSTDFLTAQEAGQETEKGELEQETDRVLLSVEPLLQYPELPTGCEVTALAMALRYAGCEVSKTTLADDFLPKCSLGQDSFTDYFWGDPRQDDGYGCLAPAIVTCAKNYLRAAKSTLKVYDLSNTSFPDLYEQLRLGRPVIVWGCMDPEWEIVYTEIIGENGRTYEWPANEHCMLLIGFDLEKGTVTVNDPLKGRTEYAIEGFSRHYNNIGMQAVVIV